MIDDCGVEWEDSFNADSEASFANGNGFSGTTVFACNDHAFKRLQAFLSLRLLNANVDAHRITRLKLGNILSQLGIFDIV
jgi:hypothetical protein